MAASRPGPDGGRWVDVPPERLSKWLDGFAHRHGTFEPAVAPDAVTLTAGDGATAVLHVPFPPLVADGRPVTSLLEHALRARRVGVLLVRLGGYAVGVFDGTELALSKVDSRLVHGRQRNGGSSQKRYARRRENEVTDLIKHAADLAFDRLVPQVRTLDAVVFGGDARAIEQVLADRRLAPLAAKRADPFLTVADPKRAILDATPPMFRAVRILVHEPVLAEPSPVD